MEHERTRSEECPLTRCRSFALKVCGLQDLTEQEDEVRYDDHRVKVNLNLLSMSHNMERQFDEMMNEKQLFE